MLKVILNFFKKTKQPSTFEGFKTPIGKIDRTTSKVNLSKIQIIPELEEEVNYIFNELGKLGDK